MTLQELARLVLERGDMLFATVRVGEQQGCYGFMVRAMFRSPTGAESVAGGWWPLLPTSRSQDDAHEAASRAAKALEDPVACLALATGAEP